MNGTEILGYIASVVTTVSALPQLYKILKTKSARDVSVPMFVLLAVGNILWFLYGLLLGSIPVVTANILLFVISSTIIIFTLKFNKAEKNCKTK